MYFESNEGVTCLKVIKIKLFLKLSIATSQEEVKKRLHVILCEVRMCVSMQRLHSGQNVTLRLVCRPIVTGLE